MQNTVAIETGGVQRLTGCFYIFCSFHARYWRQISPTSLITDVRYTYLLLVFLSTLKSKWKQQLRRSLVTATLCSLQPVFRPEVWTLGVRLFWGPYCRGSEDAWIETNDRLISGQGPGALASQTTPQGCSLYGFAWPTFSTRPRPQGIELCTPHKNQSVPKGGPSYIM